MKTYASLFSGGGLADIGAIQAGLLPIWGVEYDPDIASVYRRNIGDHVLVSRVQDADYTSLQAPYWLHMSPPCINASQAKTDSGETELDIDMASGCIRAIEALQPPMISLENVWFYRNFASFGNILKALADNGYTFKFWHLNAANFAVPQTRKRLFLVASRIQRPRKPASTHQSSKKQSSQLSLFPLAPWVGWYEAIEDLIPDLPDDEFAPWQIPLLPKEIGTALVSNGAHDQGQGKRVVTAVRPDQPSFTVTTQSGGRVRAWLVNQDSKLGTYQADLPAMTVLSSEKSADKCAFLADGTANNRGKTLTIRGYDSRAIAASASQEKRVVRAYVGGRVVRMTARAVARFQSVPDSYQLTGKKGLDFKVIGNGVPPLMQQRLMEANL